MTTPAELIRLVEDYGRVWDADAPPELAGQVFAADVVDHNPQPGQGAGAEGIRQILDLYHAVFPDMRVTVEDLIPAGERAVLRWSATGTHEGDQLGVPATHRQIRFSGIDIVRVDDGRIVERWGESNDLQVLQQIS